MQELRESVRLLLATKIGVYLMTFLIVTVAWAAHIRSLSPRYDTSQLVVVLMTSPSYCVAQVVSGGRTDR